MKRTFCILLGILLAFSLLNLVQAEEGCRWEKNCGEDERCIAADATDTIFLIYENRFPEISLWVLDTGNGERHELFFSGIEDAESRAELLLRNLRLAKGQETQLRERYGNPEELMMCLGMMSGLKAIAAEGDYFLLLANALGYCRVDMRTGETILLEGSLAFMGSDGSVAYYSNYDRKVYFLQPDQSIPEETSIQTDPVSSAVSAGCLLSDGSVWLAQRVLNPDKTESVGPMMEDVFFVHYAADGKELHRVNGGCLPSSYIPDKLLYSEKTGIGIAYSEVLIRRVLWAFGPEDDETKALLPASLTPPALRMADRGEALDGDGIPLDDNYILHPMGLSSDQESMLLLVADLGVLLSLDLKTLEGNSVIMTEEEMMDLLNEKTIERPGPLLLTYMFWNGTDLLCPNMASEGSVIRLPSGI